MSGGSPLGLGLLVAQGLLAAVVIGLAARRMYQLLWLAPLHLPAFREALTTAVGAGQLGLGRALCGACLPAFAARHALHGLDALERGGALEPALEESRLDLVHTLSNGLGPLRALGRMATPLSFLTIFVELGAAGSEQGLVALQRGLPLRLALDRALDALALGVGTLLVAAVAISIVRRAARELELALGSVGRILAGAASTPAAFTPPRTAV